MPFGFGGGGFGGGAPRSSPRPSQRPSRSSLAPSSSPRPSQRPSSSAPRSSPRPSQRPGGSRDFSNQGRGGFTESSASAPSTMTDSDRDRMGLSPKDDSKRNGSIPQSSAPKTRPPSQREGSQGGGNAQGRAQRNPNLPEDPVQPERGGRRPDRTLVDALNGGQTGERPTRGSVLRAVYRLPDGNRAARALQQFNGRQGSGGNRFQLGG